MGDTEVAIIGSSPFFVGEGQKVGRGAENGGIGIEAGGVGEVVWVEGQVRGAAGGSLGLGFQVVEEEAVCKETEAAEVVHCERQDADTVGVGGGDKFGGREGAVGAATQLGTLATTMGLLECRG